MFRIGRFVPQTDTACGRSAIVYTQGCPLRCRYCDGGILVAGWHTAGVCWEQVVEYLGANRELLDTLIFCGGEPLAQPRLPEAVTEVRALGLRVSLHTAGLYPRRFRQVLPELDWVGFDVKAGHADYASVTGSAAAGDLAYASLQLLLDAGRQFECRTTVHPDVLPAPKLLRLAQTLRAMGVNRYAVQIARTEAMLDQTLSRAPVPPATVAFIEAFVAPLFPHFRLALPDDVPESDQSIKDW
jgi:pyruvate formate lyase activating enzyme